MRLLAAPAFLLALAAAAPPGLGIVGERTYPPVPAADPFLPDSRLPGPAFWREVAQIRSDIRRARDNGWLSAREARRLDREARRLGHVGLRYAGDGLSDSERAALSAGAEALRSLTTPP